MRLHKRKAKNIILILHGEFMIQNTLKGIGSTSFEDLKTLNEHSAEYWTARELQPLLGYSQWRSFENAIKKAIISCQESGNAPEYHFAEVRKVIKAGKGATHEVQDYHLSRFACYLIAQNGDPRKTEIAAAQQYFAIQARKQELSELLAYDIERLELRKQTSEEFKALSSAAKNAGVQNAMFGVFHDAGYKGLYGGLGGDAIKNRKGIPEKEQLMDRMDTMELAANQFRMTQTRDKLQRQRIKSQFSAIKTHEEVGKEVRAAIERIGGVLPENIPAAEHIKQVARRVKSAKPKLELDINSAQGLVGKKDSSI